MVSFSASRYDKRCLLRSAEKDGIEVPSRFESEIDLGILAGYHTVGLPCRGLKGLGNHFGYVWASPEMAGLKAGTRISNYLRTGKDPNWETLLEYNRDDVMATRVVLSELLKLEERSLT